MSHTERTEECNKPQASSPRLTPEERKRDRRKRSLFLKGCERAPDEGIGARCHAPGAAGRGQGRTQGAHTHTQLTRTYGHTFRDRFGQGRNVRATVGTVVRIARAGIVTGRRSEVRSVSEQSTGPTWHAGSWEKIASAHESGISFGRERPRVSLSPNMVRGFRHILESRGIKTPI